MTALSTQAGLNFIGRYDLNRDGLSKQELQMGKMNSYFNMMTSMMTGNQQGFASAMQDLQFASVAGQNFDILSQASKTTPFGDNNQQTINPMDLMKTASNDGNVGSITPKDVKCQNKQNQQAQNQNPIMQFIMQFIQMMMQALGMGGQQNNNAFAGAGANGGANAFANAGNGGANAFASANGSGASAFANAGANGSGASALANAGSGNYNFTNGNGSLSSSFSTNGNSFAFALAGTFNSGSNCGSGVSGTALSSGRGAWGDPHYDIAVDKNGNGKTDAGETAKFDHKGKDGHTYNVFEGDGVQVKGKYVPYSDPKNPQVIGETEVTAGRDKFNLTKEGKATLNGQKLDMKKGEKKQLSDGSTLEKVNDKEYKVITKGGDGSAIKIKAGGNQMEVDPEGKFDNMNGIIGDAMNKLAKGEKMPENKYWEKYDMGTVL